MLRLYPFLLLVVIALSGCFQSNSGPDAQPDGIPLPTGVQSLPASGALSVRVYIEGESAPRFSDHELDFDREMIEIEFDVPIGQHIFTVIFDYFDAEFPRDSGNPWELARWSSDLVTVAEDEGLSLDVDVDDYLYEDSDGDGVSNKDELIARTDPGDAADYPDFLVTAVAGEGGSITPPERMAIHGSVAAFTVTPASGYSLSSVSGCNGSLEGEIYTTGAITEDCMVSASFTLNNHAVETSAGTGGTISPERQTVSHGESASFRLFLAPGFDFRDVSVTGCNGTLTLDGTDLIYITGPITAACTVSATFSLSEYAVTAVLVGAGGTISPGGRVVSHGSTASFTVAASPGYSIGSVTGCDGVLDGDTFITGTITAACAVSASFVLDSYTVTATAGANGSITPSSQSVGHGSTASFTVAASPGYSIGSVTGCGGVLDGNTYTTAPIEEACAITVSFAPNRYEVTASAGVGGSIAPLNQAVDHGATTSFSITLDAFHSVSSVSGCDGRLDGLIYTTGVITDDCTVEASFSAIVPAGVVAATGDGVVSLGWNPVANASGYRIYWGTRAAIHPDLPNSYDDMVSIGNESNHTVGELQNGREYYFVVTATASSGESGPSAEISATPQAPPVTTGLLNDTGIDWCADDDNHHLACPLSSHPGQDGDLGRDAAVPGKTGTGAAGFDFTRLDANGNVLPDNADEWSCVRDNHTGLVWEVKVNDQAHLRHRNHTYTWYDPDSDSNGGREGTRNRGSCSGSDCDTHGLVQAVNAEGLCGAADWRMPSRDELMSIVHNGRPDSPRIDSGHFPNTGDALFWSTSPSANQDNRAWNVSFDNGDISVSNKNTNARVRLVRAGRIEADAGLTCARRNSDIVPTTPDNDFTELDGGAVVRHERTGLEWRRCSSGQAWESGQCVGTPAAYSWRDALVEAAAAGAGWRLPNRNELASIVELACQRPAINSQAFPDTPDMSFWSSSPDAGRVSDAWQVNFSHGGVERNGKLVLNGVRLVRSGQ